MILKSIYCRSNIQISNKQKRKLFRKEIEIVLSVPSPEDLEEEDQTKV